MIERSILARMKEGILVFTERGAILSCNASFVSLLVGEIESIELLELSLLPQSVREAMRDLSQDGILEPRDVTIGERNERCVQLYGASLEEGTLLLVANDVTDLRRLERIRADFIANVAHELRTPMAALKGALELLDESATEGDQDAMKLLQMARRHSARLEEIVEDSLRLARLEAGHHEEFVRVPVDPMHVARHAIDLVREHASSRGVRLQLVGSYEADIPGVPTLLEQALVNLLENAVNHSERDQPVTLHIRHGEGLEFCVEDNGCGIPEDKLHRIFERFYRVDQSRSRQRGGTGLGLAIVKHVAALHGGRVTAESEVGRGSQFRIFIPAHKKTFVASAA